MDFADVIKREIIWDYLDEPNVITRVHGAWGRMVGGDAEAEEVMPWASDEPLLEAGKARWQSLPQNRRRNGALLTQFGLLTLVTVK